MRLQLHTVASLALAALPTLALLASFNWGSP